jgi:acyl-CoA-binding protein
MGVDFEKSGAGTESRVKAMTLDDVCETAIKCGFVRSGIDRDRPIRRRADVDGFFRMFSVNSLSNFKRVFAANALKAPRVGGEVFVEEKARDNDDDEVTWECPSVDEYETLAKNWDKEHVHKWRMLPKPGGAVCRPDDWYALYAAKMQVEKGDVEGEKPMWASHGGIAYDEREKWDFRIKLKGTSRDDAKKKFCEAYGRAMLKEREGLNFRKY